MSAAGMATAESSSVASSTDRFNRICAVVGLLFLVLLIGAKTAWYEHRHLPQMQDFPQYYMGGLIALSGQWESMYPVPVPGSGTNPGFVGNSTLRPGYAKLADEVGVGEYAVRYIQVPPLSLLLIPLALLPLKLSFFLWVVLLTLAAWGIGLQAAQMYRLSLPQRAHTSRIPGLLILLVCFSPQALRWVRVGNMSVLIGWLIGYATLELVRRDGVRGAAALFVGAVAKYALLVLLPLYVLLWRWRTLAWAAAMGLVLVGTSLLVMRTGNPEDNPYRVFSRQIVPTLGRTSAIDENQALYTFLLRVQGISDERGMPRAGEIAFRLTQIASLGLVLAAVATRVRRGVAPAMIFAGALALVSWLLIFSPIFWEHYHAYLAPFWGWLAAEAATSMGRKIAAVAAIAMAWVPTELVVQQLHLHRLPEPLFSHLLWSAVLMGGLAVWALIRPDGRVYAAEPRE